ncbi:hypothetical protein TRAPUB_4976 [Trametes pubescens]|uniref:Uncharacterized protein n=1 Tax=Trametes pubescens TaxID=154538 RepID=A0A1M2V9W8_TRAPU|nr:hypothetical protein TRAPUB_4976 [Trametes pubescens]
MNGMRDSTQGKPMDIHGCAGGSGRRLQAFGRGCRPVVKVSYWLAVGMHL